jgi:hypothetical protein
MIAIIIIIKIVKIILIMIINKNDSSPVSRIPVSRILRIALFRKNFLENDRNFFI